MLGLMMDRPLLTTDILKHAVRNYSATPIITRSVEGPIHRYTVGDSAKRIAQLANALRKAGIKRGDRIGVIGWNTYRQFEMYYAVGGLGAVLHTVNPRLGPENATFVINHAEDSHLFYDLTFAPLVAAMRPHLKTVKHFCLLTDGEHANALPSEMREGVSTYEELIEGEPESFDWPEFDENTAVAMCYTSGTTGDPKGVLYSHRAVVIQALTTALPAALGLKEGDVFLPVVPMFHVNAWNTPYTCLLVGATQVFPGPRLDGEGLYEMFESEKVTFSAGVPTVWLGILDYLKSSGKRLTTLKGGMSGGSALPEALIRGFAEYGVDLMQGWGMTEMSPVGTVGALPPEIDALPLDEKMSKKLWAGRALPYVDMRIVDAAGEVLPADGAAEGHLQVRGPSIVKEYFKATAPTLTIDGWFDTGDVAILHPGGFLQITDRAKDVIKTGGEWVSSIDIENAAMMHPGVGQAGVIGVYHPKWQERPLLIIVKAAGEDPTAEEILEFIKPKLDKIAWPNAIEFIDHMPIGATGKVLKTELRKRFKDYTLPE